VNRAPIAAILALAIGCQSTPLADIEPGGEPPLDSDEAGFWMSMEKAEKEIATSGNRIRDPELDAYLKGVICRIAPDYCSATRVYVLRQPDFNASMAPNGMMVVWSGLLIRVQNEAQLAAVLGHEVGHYQRRHTLSIFRRARKTTNALMAIMLLSGGIVPAAANAAVLIGMGTLYKHSRDQEAEADAIGIERLAKTGYDPREVAEIWAGVVREVEADKQGPRLGFYESHPAPAARLREMASRAQGLLTAENERGTRTAEFDNAVSRLRVMLLNDEVAMRKHARSEVVIDRLLEAELITKAEAAFYRGELHRVRGDKGDDLRAIQHYREAVSAPDPVPLAHRNLGLVLRRSGDRIGAREAFQRYVELAPDANDRTMVDTYIQELTP
jgi:predicted Zn-dependent protease